MPWHSSRNTESVEAILDNNSDTATEQLRHRQLSSSDMHVLLCLSSSLYKSFCLPYLLLKWKWPQSLIVTSVLKVWQLSNFSLLQWYGTYIYWCWQIIHVLVISGNYLQMCPSLLNAWLQSDSDISENCSTNEESYTDIYDQAVVCDLQWARV